MTLEQFNQYCGALPHASFVEQWHGSQVWKVGGKVFALGKMAHGMLCITFKTSTNNFSFLRENPSFRPAPYFASRGMPWIQQIGPADDDALCYYLNESYWLVAYSLSNKEKIRLTLLTRESN